VPLEKPGREAVTVAEAARRLSVHVATIRRMLDRGDLRRIRIGRLVRVDLASLDRFIGAGGNDPAAESKADPVSADQIKALGAKCAHLGRLRDEQPTTIKVKTYPAVSRQFGREITSWTNLLWVEADWLLDVLAAEIKHAS
jgi:excisionase family DNA binding protein